MNQLLDLSKEPANFLQAVGFPTPKDVQNIRRALYDGFRTHLPHEVVAFLLN